MASHFGPIKDATAVLYQAHSTNLLEEPMPIEMPARKPLRIAVVLTAAGIALAGCAGDEGVKGVAEAAGMATTPQEAKSFVRETRPTDMQYIPVGSTIPVDQLCPGPKPPPAYTPTGQAARFAAPKPARGPNDPCKKRSDFEKIESQLEAKRQANESAGNQAKSLGTTPPPQPAKIPQN